MHLRTSFFIYSFLIIGLLASCQPKDTFDWNAGLSGPKNYPSGAPFVEYFYQGQSIAGASSGTGADQGWGITSGGYVGGDKYKHVPDSMAVKWVCSVDNLVYKGGFKFPLARICNPETLTLNCKDLTTNASKGITTTAGMNITETVTLNKPVSADLQSVPATVRHNTNNLKSQSLWARITNPRYRVFLMINN
jgi:hypothetical protein